MDTQETATDRLGEGGYVGTRAANATQKYRSPSVIRQEEKPKPRARLERKRQEKSQTANRKDLLLSPGIQHPLPPLVGRTSELAHLHRWLDTALSGHRQVVFVSGEAGIGKSTLVAVFLDQIRTREGVRVTTGHCVEQYGPGEAYLPLLEATMQLCHGPGKEHRIDGLRRYAPSWLVQLPGLVATHEREQLHAAVHGTSRERMLREMVAGAEHFTTTRGLVVVLEDLHWSDVSTLEWLTTIARRREPAKLMIIGIYRPTDMLTSGHPLKSVVHDLRAHGHCQEVHVPPLAEPAVEAYLAARIPGATATTFPWRGFLPMLYQRTEGHPLFLVNMVEDLLRQEGMQEEGGSWAAGAGTFSNLATSIPDNVRHFIERQVERLNDAEQQVLEAASVAGAHFAVAEVTAGLNTNSEHVEAHCERLARTQQFLQADGVAEWPDGTLSGRYRFRHALYHEVVYSRVGDLRRIHLHRRIADRKEAAYGTRAREIAAELAVHFERGHEIQRAVSHLQKASENAVCCRAHPEAITHLTKALTFIRTLPVTPERDRQERALQAALDVVLASTNGEPQQNFSSVSPYESCNVEHTTTRPSLPTPNSKLRTALRSPSVSSLAPGPRLVVPLSLTSTPQSPTPNTFRHEGDYWTLAFAGEMCRVRHTLGMQYLAQLLRHPQHEFSVLALTTESVDLTLGAALIVRGNRTAARFIEPSHSIHPEFSDADECLDARAKAAYKQRLQELRAELDEAQTFNDLGRTDKIQAEIDFLTAELTRAVGLGGRMRKAASPLERARVNVTLAIKTALRRITVHHATLGQYLACTIKTGYTCAYTPDPSQPVKWED